MNRYTCHSEITVTHSPYDLEGKAKAISVMEPAADGQWVRWEDVEAMRSQLEARIPDLRIERLEKALGLVTAGKCPECQQFVRGYKPTFGSLAPEAWATLREAGIDPSTWHAFGCSLSR